ncbi:MAG: peptide deformylase [Candidatus Buchananbacteria bacterium]|nr:peptide deformylase [Candidatus Buchananbacteria bacterium]
MKSIVLHPDPRLRQRAAEISDVANPEIQTLIPEMIESMKAHNGVGLAAPQIGELVRLIIVSHKSGPIAMINPKIVHKSFKRLWEEEGCLSIPGVYGDVKRHLGVTATYTDAQGQPQKLEAEGLLARIIQHEVDHLNGVLFIDKAKNIHELDPKDYEQVGEN